MQLLFLLRRLLCCCNFIICCPGFVAVVDSLFIVAHIVCGIFVLGPCYVIKCCLVVAVG